MLDKEVDAVATELLRELVRFQDRQFHKDPVKVIFQLHLLIKTHFKMCDSSFSFIPLLATSLLVMAVLSLH